MRSLPEHTCVEAQAGEPDSEYCRRCLIQERDRYHKERCDIEARLDQEREFQSRLRTWLIEFFTETVGGRR